VFDTAYTSTQLPMAPLPAGSALDVWHGQLPTARTGFRKLHAEPGLWLSKELQPPGTDHRILRRIRGTLWVLGRPVPVELELLTWSNKSSELGLRPMRLWWPVQTTSYLDHASATVGRIAETIVRTSSVALPLRDANSVLKRRSPAQTAERERKRSKTRADADADSYSTSRA
jgi:hypothetical protein